MKEKTSVTIRRIKLDNINIDGLTPMEIISVASDVEARINQISQERNLLDVYKLALYAALEYAAKAYNRDAGATTQNKEDTRQLDEAILKLKNCLEQLPLK